MNKRGPYRVIRSRYVTEKTTVLEQLQHTASNRCIARCESPKFVFIVDKDATKAEIAHAVEMIYAEKKIKVKKVNTINVKPKKRRVRGRLGYRSGVKKAIVTLDKGDTIDEGA
jgi:large subunit ribosomal protein L23